MPSHPVEPGELDELRRALPLLSRVLGEVLSLDLCSPDEELPTGSGVRMSRLTDEGGAPLATLVARVHPSDQEYLAQEQMNLLSSEIDEVATELIQMEMLSRKVLLGRSTRKETLKILLAAVRGRLPHSPTAIALASPESVELRIVAHRKLPQKSLRTTLSSTDGPVGQTLRGGSPRAYPARRFLLDGGAAESVTVVPLMLGHSGDKLEGNPSPLGAILVVSDEDHPLTGGDLEYLRRVGVHGTVLVHNVTLLERLQSSEEMYRTLVEQARLGMALLDRGGRLRYVNELLREIRNHEISETESFLDWVIPEGRQAVESLIKRSAAGHIEPNPVETSLTTSDGVVPIALSVTPITDQDGHVSGHVAIVRNRIVELALETDRRALEREIQQAEKLSALGKFVAGIAHELNNPLTVVLGYAELLSRETGLSNRQMRSVQQILDHARRTSHIVEDLLTFARPEEASRPESVDLGALIREALTACTELRGQGMTSHLDLDEPLPPVSGSRRALFQVLANIFGNALDAMEPNSDGTRELYVSLRADTNLQQIEIRDTGPGLTEPKRVFDPFYTTKSIGQGTGLGLSIAYGIVRDHQGDLQAVNHPDGGACFIISLPEVPVSTARARPMGGGRGATTGELWRARVEPQQILVVDDEPAILDLIADALGEDFAVTPVPSVDTALALTEKIDFDLILSDLRLADGLTGIDFYEFILEKDPKLAERFVFMTGDTLGQSSRVFLSRTQRPCLPKPFKTSQLVEFVSKFARR